MPLQIKRTALRKPTEIEGIIAAVEVMLFTGKPFVWLAFFNDGEFKDLFAILIKGRLH